MICCSNLLLFSRLDVYIYDYLLKRDLHATAKAFMAEGKVAEDPVGNNVLRAVCCLNLLFLFSYVPFFLFFLSFLSMYVYMSDNQLP